MAESYPKTITRGGLKGRTFDTHADYLAALEAAKLDGTVKPRAARTPRIGGSANGVTRAMAESLVMYGNIVLSVIPQTREDVLEPTEIEALTLGILETARANKFFANLIVKTCQLQSGSRLAFAVGAVVARRVARREILPLEARIPVEFAAVAMLNMLAQDVSLAPTEAVNEPAIPAESNGHSDVPPVPASDPFSVASR